MEAQREGPIAGVDPGLTGSVTFILSTGDAIIHDLPILRVHSKGYLDGYVLRKLFEEYMPRLIVVELQGIRQMQGLSSTAQTWLVYGGIVSVALSMDCPVEIVDPKTWMRALGLLGKPKEASRAKALKLYPKSAHMLKRKKDHNRAEGLLIGHWGKSVA